MVGDICIWHAPGVGIHSSPGLVEDPCMVSSPPSRMRGALCNIAFATRWVKTRALERIAWNVSSCPQHGKQGWCKGTCCPDIAVLEEWGLCHHLACHTHPRKLPVHAKILNFGFWWWMNTACTSVISYTHLCLKPSVCVSPFLPCFPNGTTRFSTTVVRMIHKTSLFGWVMYLHLLLQGIWWSSFLLLASPFGLRWLKCYSWEQPLLEYRLLFSTGSSCSSFSKGSGCFPPARCVSSMRYACYSRKLVSKKLNWQRNPSRELITDFLWYEHFPIMPSTWGSG